MGFVSSDKRSQLEHTRRVLTDAINDMTDEYESDLVEEECSNDSCNSVESSSSSEMVDDISSSSSSSSSLVLSRDGPLYELSELMAQLPIKRGLSKYYQGKSESFGSLAKLKSFQDLAKRSRWPTKSPFRGPSQSQSQTLSPKGNIVKNKKISLFSSLGKMTSLLDTISVQSHF